jgi:putative glutamine amidotransferase
VLHELYGPTLAVNSLHHQTVDRVADGWAVAARSSIGGDVEALEWPGHDLVAVQWHPEHTAARDPIQQRLFDALVRAAAESNARSRAAGGSRCG